MDEMMKALEEATTRNIATECELSKTQSLLLQILKEMKEHPVAGFKWETILSNDSLSKIFRIENGSFLSDEMTEIVNDDTKEIPCH